MDIGCYPISLSRFIFNAEPARVVSTIDRDPSFQTDRRASVVLDFGGPTSTFTCSTQMAPYQRVNIFGDKGRVEIEIPFNAPPDHSCRLWHQRADASIEEIAFDNRQPDVGSHVAHAGIGAPTASHPTIDTCDLRASSSKVARRETGSASQVGDSQPVEWRHPPGDESEHPTTAGHHIGLPVAARFLALDATPQGPIAGAV